MQEFVTISDTIRNLRKHIESFAESINSAIERSGTSPELSVRQFFFKTGEGQMPSRLFRGEGTFNALLIDESGVVMKQILKAGGLFTAHCHNDATEITIITKGVVREVISNRILTPGHSFRAESGEVHQYEIIEDSVLITTFVFIPAE